jgi:hypothetical protein
MKSRIAIAVSALTLGTALTAVPTFAQTYGARNGPEVQQESTGRVPQRESNGCVHFQQGCSDKPYPMGQNASPNSARTGAQESREARSASSGGRISGERTSGNRERLSSARTRGSARVSERERIGGSARVSERAPTSDEYMRAAAPEPSGVDERVAEREGVRGEAYGFGGRRDFYNAAPGVEVADADRGAVAWCETRFHSFDPATGTYMGFDGIRHPCP